MLNCIMQVSSKIIVSLHVEITLFVWKINFDVIAPVLQP